MKKSRIHKNYSKYEDSVERETYTMKLMHAYMVDEEREWTRKNGENSIFFNWENKKTINSHTHTHTRDSYTRYV